MIDRARTGARRLVRSTRRFAKSALKRLGLRPSAPRPYKPAFSDQRLAARLGIPATDERNNETSHRALRLAFSGARRAREVFGKRFFIAPAEVHPLCETLETLRPGSIEELMSRVAADYREGIPVYAQQGPPLGPAFPWDALPLGPGGDHMYRKRPHRFAFVPRNALACLFQPAAAIRLDGMLDGWMRHAGQGRDPLCHDSNLAVIQRLLALSWGWAFLAGREEEESAQGLALEWRLMMIIEDDIRFLEPLLGQSAPNNHLLADRFAAWFLRTVFPELLDTPDAGDEQRWCDELLAQTYPDGGSFEHSSHYHEFACEMGAAYLLLSKRGGIAPEPRVKERVRALLAYQCAMTGPEACPLPIGNAIEDTLFPLDPGEAWCAGSLREIYRALFEPGLSPTPVEDYTIIRAFWLLGGGMAPRQQSGLLTTPLPRNFMQAGLHVMPDSRLDARLTFRSGPAPGTALSAGHTHADILAVYMSVQGRPFLVDAGTYTYRGHSGAWDEGAPDWRAYFAGPKAHNGLSVAEVDPLGRLSRDFRSRDVNSRVVTDQAFGAALSFAEGTVQSDGPYEGLRRACVHVEGEYWLVLDHKPDLPLGEYPSWFGLQFAPSLRLEQHERRISASFPGENGTLFILPSPTLGQPQLLFESTKPMGGWVSPRYGQRLGAIQLRYPASDRGGAFSLMLSTDIRHRRMEFVQDKIRSDGSRLIQLRSGDIDDWIVFRRAENAPASTEVEEIVFDGRLLWVRTERGRARTLRWLQASHVVWPSLSINIRTQSDIRVDLDLDENLNANCGQSFSCFDWPSRHS